MTTSEALSKEKVDVLKKMCKERGLSGYSKLKKSELIDLLSSKPAAGGSVSTSPVQSTTTLSTSADAGSPSTSHHSLHAVDVGHQSANPFSSATLGVSSAFQSTSNADGRTFGDQAAPNLAESSAFSTSRVQFGISTPDRFSDPNNSIAIPISNLTSGCGNIPNAPMENPSPSPQATVSEHPDAESGSFTIGSGDSNQAGSSDPSVSKPFLATSGGPWTVTERKRNEIPGSGEHGGRGPKRPKLISKGKRKEVSSEQELLDSRLMPPPQSTQASRPGLGPFPPNRIQNNPAASPTLSDHEYLPHQPQRDESAYDGITLPSVPIFDVALCTSTGGSLPAQNVHAPVSSGGHSSNHKRAAPSKLQPLVFRGPKRPGADSVLEWREPHVQSLLLPPSNGIVRHVEEGKSTRESYGDSFLYRFFSSSPVGFSPLADHLWSSPDHPLQATVALR